MVNGPVAFAAPEPDALKSAPRKVVRKDAVRIVLDDVTPKSLKPKSKNLKVKAKVYNQTAQPLVNVTVSLRVGQRLTTRSSIQTFAVDPGGDVGNQIAVTPTPIIPANGSAPVTLTAKNLDGFPLLRSALGVYPLSVVASSSDGTRLAHLHTFITYAPAKGIKKTKVAYVWPLIDKPTQVTENQFLDDSLAESVTEGRLSDLLSAVTNTSTPVTLAIDPDLLAAVKRIGTSDYTVGKVLDQKPVPTKQSPGAQSWLTKLQEDKNKIFLTPYADADTVALVRSRLRGSVSLLKKSYDKGERDLALATLNKQESYPKLAWPVGGVIDQRTINETAAIGREVFLLNSTELASGTGLTANAASKVQTSRPKVADKTAIAYDVTLQNIISADTRPEGAALPAELRYLAETAMINAEEPSTAGTLVVAPDRRWSPSPDFANSLLASGGPQNDWLQPVSLETVAKLIPPVGKRRGFMGYVKATGAELPVDYLRPLPEMLADGTSFSTIFTPVDTTYKRPALRAASSYWRTHPKARVSTQRLSSDLLRAEMDKVAVIEGGRSLAGDSGTVNLTISNSLDRPVRVIVKVESTDSTRLVVGASDKSFETPKVIEAGANDQISVPMTFLSPPKGAEKAIDVLVIVTDPEGREVSKVAVEIEYKELTLAGVIITIGALAVVVGGVGFRGMRARRLRKEVEDTQHGGATGVL
jgi:hypothetical protein